MIVIIGSRYRTRLLEGEKMEMHYCPKCGLIRQFSPAETRRWLTLFFLPVFPTDKPERILCCTTCGLESRAKP